ncbi:MAG: BON domain-containing protein [Rhodospirillales bacterium]|jgi:osmotically-inducible protein OsmY|nr:BON domain-containing protein [Rhodospirillales bacterium]
MPDDQTLQALVMEELEWEPSLEAAHIGVTAEAGVVTLSGHVASYAAKAAAERAAGRVRGVKAIAEEIEVRLPEDHKRSDTEIAERALRILSWDVEVPADRIQVKVEHGMATLSGDVGYYFQKAAAEADIRRLGGVRGVVNLVRVAPAAQPAGDPAAVRQKIESALRRNAEVEAGHILIGVEGGRVTLRGSVKTWWERQVAETAARSAPGVTEVNDEIDVRP